MASSDELDTEKSKHSEVGGLGQKSDTLPANNHTSDSITENNDGSLENGLSKLEIQHSAEGITKDNELNQGPEENGSVSTDEGPPLYCKKNHQSHGSLLTFGIYICPMCEADLEAPDVSDSKSESTEQENVDQPDDTEPPKPEAPIKHSIEIRDKDGDVVGTEPYKASIFIPSTDQSLDQGLVLETVATVIGDFLRWDVNYSTEGVLTNPKHTFIYNGCEVRIHSKYIIDAINTVAPFLHQIPEVAPFAMFEPYEEVGYYLQALKDYAATATAEDVSVSNAKSQKCSETAAEHLNILFDCLADFEYETKIREEEQRHKKGCCTFRMLWLALRPGMTVCMVSDGILRAYVIDSIVASTDERVFSNCACAVLSFKTTEKMKYKIRLWNLQYDTRFVGRQFTDVVIPHFDGEKPLQSLKVVPIDIYEAEAPGTRARLEEYGRLWYKSLCGKQVAYQGVAVQTPSKQLKGRAYIDPAGYKLERDTSAQSRKFMDIDFFYRSRDLVEDTYCACEDCQGMRSHPSPNHPWKDYDVINPKVVPNLDLPNGPQGKYHRYLLCDRIVPALMLKTRTWELLDVANCKEPTFETNALDSLVMPEDRKKMIKALVMRFRDSKSNKQGNNPWKADLIEGKGEGTIFLLHGGPGIGKTFTAECIAEYTEKPLLSLTSADIGTDELLVEEKLSRWLDNAERWGAVLLIDEADIYLERRMMTDLKRNSLVSVFLRCLEYYRGILFLTTNRVGTFDDAFISRIHVVIKYDALEDSHRRIIWKQFLDKLKRERKNFRIDMDARNYILGDGKTSLYKQQWNGREIRNAFQTAIALADYRATETGEDAVLEVDDLDQVSNMTKQFKSYLDTIHGGKTEGQRAQLAKQRAEEEAW